MSINSVERFVRLLKQHPSGAVFNPWWEIDDVNDVSQSAPTIRREQLNAYLQERLGRAKIAIVGEALGYRGGHFSGIAMTSERILLGGQPDIVAALSQRRSLGHHTANGGQRSPLQILWAIKPRRTSKPTICADGFSEPTATIVWRALLNAGVLPDQFVLWNAFSWHSFDSPRGLLSNRMPNKSERAVGLPVLKAFIKLFRPNQIVALGKIAAAQLEQLGFTARCVRHPASGG